jgi:hypothetical protein
LLLQKEPLLLPGQRDLKRGGEPGPQLVVSLPPTQVGPWFSLVFQ